MNGKNKTVEGQTMEHLYVIGLDQSTQGTKAILMDSEGEITAKAFLPHEQIISSEGWVSHDGEEIFRNSIHVIRQLIEDAAINKNSVAAIGISNQRETTIAWDHETGKPVEHAIVWQCSRAKEITDAITDESFRKYVREQTGIPLSPYFPAAKAAWILKHSKQAAELAKADQLCIGTIDSWLIYRLTEGKVFKTDYSNASRTQLFNLHSLSWDVQICEALGIPVSALPKVEFSDEDFGSTTLNGFFDTPIPIRAVLGDSHAALLGQGCVRPGMAKATYGTGSSIMMNIGPKFKESHSGLVTSLAWGRNRAVDYVLEGNINYAGAVITWLQKDLGLFENAKDTAGMAENANPDDKAYLVPAFSGLGAPYWKDSAQAMLCGMSRTTGKNEIVRAGLESIAYQVTDIAEAMSADSGVKLNELRVDGGPTANPYLMQFQSDIARARICVQKAEELSAMGVAFLAGIGTGLYPESILTSDRLRKTYMPQMAEETRNKKYDGWKKAVQKA